MNLIPPENRQTLAFWLTHRYVALLELLFALLPLIGIAYLSLFQDPALTVHNHGFHEIAIGVAITLSAFVSYITWRCYQSSGEPFLRWLTLGFLGFTLVYAPHGILTRTADHNVWLFILYGPLSRIVMSGCLVKGLLVYGQPAEDPEKVAAEHFWRKGILGCLVLDITIAVLAYSPIAGELALRLSLEGCALLLSCLGVGLALRWRKGSPVMSMVAIALAAFAQSSLAFMLGKIWNHQWWLAHAIFAAGFFLLSYGVVQAFLTTRAFSTIFSQEEMMLRLLAEKTRAEAALQKLQEAHLDLERLAATDPLTGASNRRHFLQRLQADRSRCLRQNRPLGLLALDLDHFKSINDNYGHLAGDEVLKTLVSTLKAELRPSDVVGRMGGEEFMVLLADTNHAEARSVAERLRAAVAALEIPSLEGPLKVTVSIGIAFFGDDGDMVEAVFKAADLRLYAAKAHGRNRVVDGAEAESAG